MISFCTTFYPWYREHDRSEEIFNVLIRSLNEQIGIDEIELCLTNGAVTDVWNKKGKERIFDNKSFLERIGNEFKGQLKYELTDELINISDNGIRRYWVANGLKRAIQMATNNYIVITGMDCYFGKDFIKDYFNIVKVGTAWVIRPCACLNVEAISFLEDEDNTMVRQYYPARGLVGVSIYDYYRIGGYNIDYIKNRSDSNFFDRLDADDTINIVEEHNNHVFHVFHPGSNMRRPI